MNGGARQKGILHVTHANYLLHFHKCSAFNTNNCNDVYRNWITHRLYNNYRQWRFNNYTTTWAAKQDGTV